VYFFALANFVYSANNGAAQRNRVAVFGWGSDSGVRLEIEWRCSDGDRVVVRNIAAVFVSPEFHFTFGDFCSLADFIS